MSSTHLISFVDQIDHRKKQPRLCKPDELSLISTSNRLDQIESDATFQAKNSPADQPWRTSKGNLRNPIGPTVAQGKFYLDGAAQETVIEAEPSAGLVVKYQNLI
jgi:hypothetical protein